MGFSRQKDWSGLPFPTPGDLPDPEIEPVPFPPPALAGGFLITGATREALLLFMELQLHMLLYYYPWIFEAQFILIVSLFPSDWIISIDLSSSSLDFFSATFKLLKCLQ